MVTKELLRQVIYEQRALVGEPAVEREALQQQTDYLEITVVTGVRRCGKSVLMQQIKAGRSEQDFSLVFDDDRLLHFTVDDFQTLCEVFVEDFGPQHTYYLDEVQLISGWERFVERLYRQCDKVYVAGSNAFMLSREMGTLLTGRHMTMELYPMSLSEYAVLKNISWAPQDFYTTTGKAKLLNMQSGYLKDGGFPQYLSTGNPRYLKELYNDIIYRDIVVRHKLPSDRQIREVAYYLASNFTHRITYNGLAQAAGIKSSETANVYVGYLEEAYLVGVVRKYDYKVGEQQKSPKKVYFIDNGLVGQIGLGFSQNNGARLENAIYLELKRRGEELFYFYDKSECDFIVYQEHNITFAYQVTISLSDAATRQREERGLVAAMDAFHLTEGYIITQDEYEEKTLPDGRIIHIVPFYRWALNV